MSIHYIPHQTIVYTVVPLFALLLDQNYFRKHVNTVYQVTLTNGCVKYGYIVQQNASENGIIFLQQLKIKSALKGSSQRCHKRTIFGSMKNHSV